MCEEAEVREVKEETMKLDIVLGRGVAWRGALSLCVLSRLTYVSLVTLH